MEEVRNTIQSMFANNKACWDMIDEMGGDTSMPHNLQNMAEAILSIPTGPAVPTSLAELKEMVNRGREIAIGTEIPDTYNDVSNPLIVVQNLNSSNNSVYGGANGVILQRKFITDVGQIWNSTATSNNYVTSTINTFLNSVYLNRCSTGLQGMITEIEIPVVTREAGDAKVSAKWFLPSIEEIYGEPSAQYAPGYGREGLYFPYWKAKTGLSAPSNAANAGRIAKVGSSSGAAGYWWLRSYHSNLGNAWGVVIDGMLYYYGVANTNIGVAPCCFVGKDTPSQASTLETKSPLVITPEYFPSVEKVKVEIKPKVETAGKESE